MPTTEANGIKLFYEDVGHGAPVLLIMGLGSQIVHWEPTLIEGLVARGFRVITYDNRDVGESTRMHHLRVPTVRSLLVRSLLGMSIDAPYTLRDMARDGVGLLDALNIETAHIIGVSMGGMIGQQLAIDHPSRVLSLTSIMSHPGDALSRVASPRAIRALFAPMPRDRQGAIERYVAVRRALAGPGFPFNEHGYRHRAGLAYDRSIYPRGFMRQIAAIAAAPNRIPALRNIHIPALVVHGTHDPLVRPRGGRATANALPNARLFTVPGLGHELPPQLTPLLLEEIVAVTKRTQAATQQAS